VSKICENRNGIASEIEDLMIKVKNIWELKTIDESYKVASNNI